MGLLKNKVAIITGAGRGLGAAHAHRLAREGAAIVINDVGKNADGEYSAVVTANAINAAGGRAIANIDDVSHVATGAALLQNTLEHFGRVDVLINNAGILRDKTLLKMEESDWDLSMQVNLKSVYAITRPVFAWMKANGGGVIVNTSSTSGLLGNFGQANYAAAKAGVWGFSNVLAIEGAKYGIRVWTLAPAAQSVMLQDLIDQDAWTDMKPEHVAEVVLYMVSDLSAGITGKTLFASGQRIMELKMVAAEGIAGPGRDAALDAAAIAAQAGRLFTPFADLTVADLTD